MDAGPLVDCARRPLLRRIATCSLILYYDGRRHEVAAAVTLVWQPLVRHQSVLVQRTLHVALQVQFLGRWLWVSLRLQFTQGVRHELATRQSLLLLRRPDCVVVALFLVRLIRA